MQNEINILREEIKQIKEMLKWVCIILM
jgi:hypothetical protein